jgi:hypothetical protein
VLGCLVTLGPCESNYPFVERNRLPIHADFITERLGLLHPYCEIAWT